MKPAPHPRGGFEAAIRIASAIIATAAVAGPSAADGRVTAHPATQGGAPYVVTWNLRSEAVTAAWPVDAIKRRFVEDPYYGMFIDEAACIGCCICVKGCGICVKGCDRFGNGSMFVQIRHDRCVNCNQCAIAQSCPAQAISRVPTTKPYRIKTVRHGS